MYRRTCLVCPKTCSMHLAGNTCRSLLVLLMVKPAYNEIVDILPRFCLLNDHCVTQQLCIAYGEMFVLNALHCGDINDLHTLRTYLCADEIMTRVNSERISAPIKTLIRGLVPRLQNGGGLHWICIVVSIRPCPCIEFGHVCEYERL